VSIRLRLTIALALVAGTLTGQHLPGPVRSVSPAYAACFVGWAGCIMDNTRTSTMEVLHRTTGGTKVAPDTQDVWDVTAS
jgi:hypothetical protein